MTQQEFIDFLITFNTTPPRREIMMYTGVEGENNLKREHVKAKLQKLAFKAVVSLEEEKNLLSMIDSPDMGNCEIVELILLNKERI
jgi:hypothetical protein